MIEAYADFHVHTGLARGRPVKMAASHQLTVAASLDWARRVKGLHVVGLVDAVCDPVLDEIRELCRAGRLTSVPGGGLLYDDALLVVLGSEIEIRISERGAAHFGCWMPSIEAAADFQQWLKTVQANTGLSSQVAKVDPAALAEEVHARDGLFVVHHIFTPFKGLLGSAVDRVADALPASAVDAVELGLSADADMADRLAELRALTFLSNSDAHSLRSIAREFNVLAVERLTFDEIRAALARSGGRGVRLHVGLYPPIGKYYRTRCRVCGEVVAGRPCACGTDAHVVQGVWDRIQHIADSELPMHPPWRAPYRYVTPVSLVPGVGPRTYEKLIRTFGGEAQMLVDPPSEQALAEVVGHALAARLERAFRGQLAISPGGAGRYGRLERT
ncbi:endonuclease Q family protein [Alicyclobacillus vulcanalis]|uniref:TIGR00375 family protein n=1 Tax=Alicyclobacillus vulcanalis TaxID=252246 RepID=A0A1N7KMD2_9BACL|nr:endonuclease Q family protein [Alicyclobacillus vulcanalis]SIS62590.1 TIGR00375 family protein [Alicyclobacillus vulcanalis]